ncbi:MAG: hypothetical protein QM705_15325 [Ancrocorticia sp.]
MQGSDLQQAISTVAQYRHVTPEPLGPLLSQMPPLAQRKWEVWRRKQRLEQSTPESFADLLSACFELTEPALADSVNDREWNPATRTWEATNTNR